MSDIEGEKPKILKNIVTEKKIGFFSTGIFWTRKIFWQIYVHGNISKWTNETKIYQ